MYVTPVTCEMCRYAYHRRKIGCVRSRWRRGLYTENAYRDRGLFDGCWYRCALVFIFQPREVGEMGGVNSRVAIVDLSSVGKNYSFVTTLISVHRPAPAAKRLLLSAKRIYYVTDTFREFRRAERNTDLSSRGPWYIMYTVWNRHRLGLKLRSSSSSTIRRRQQEKSTETITAIATRFRK